MTQNSPTRVKEISVREGGLRNTSDDFNRAVFDLTI
jgi:hypothetical protein